MNKLLNVLLFFLLAQVPHLVFSQAGVYWTKEDYLNDKMEKKDKGKPPTDVFGVLTVRFEHKGKKENFRPNAMYAFQIDNGTVILTQPFPDPRGNFFIMSIRGAICLYSIGSTALTKHNGKLKLNISTQILLSKGPKSQLVFEESNASNGTMQGDLLYKLIGDDPEFMKLAEKNRWNYLEIVLQYNKKYPTKGDYVKPFEY